MAKPLVFISHISEEKEIAVALKNLVESSFLDMIDVFVSSDPTSLKMGRQWLNEIEQALRVCAIEIILASPESVKRPWINFEGGSGWIRGIHVIPLCHSGMTPGKLPQPLAALQSAIATDKRQLGAIFPVLAEAIGCSLPQVDLAPFISAVQKFESDSHEIAALKATTPVALTDGLSPHELATLIEIAEQTNSPADPIAIYALRDALEKAGYRGVAVSLALKVLGRKSLVETAIIVRPTYGDTEEYPGVKLTDDGWNWLDANQDKLVLKVEAVAEKPVTTGYSGDDIPFWIWPNAAGAPRNAYCELTDQSPLYVAIGVVGGDFYGVGHQRERG